MSSQDIAMERALDSADLEPFPDHTLASMMRFIGVWAARRK